MALPGQLAEHGVGVALDHFGGEFHPGFPQAPGFLIQMLLGERRGRDDRGMDQLKRGP